MNRRRRQEHGQQSVPLELAGLAAIFSFLVPGLGHALLRAWLRGTIWFAGWLVITSAGDGGVNPIAVGLMFLAGIDALLFGRSLTRDRS
jgi:hypothetical protein